MISHRNLILLFLLPFQILVLLWKLLEDNPRFMPYVLKHCNVTQLVVPLCYLLFEARKVREYVLRCNRQKQCFFFS